MVICGAEHRRRASARDDIDSALFWNEGRRGFAAVLLVVYVIDSALQPLGGCGIRAQKRYISSLNAITLSCPRGPTDKASDYESGDCVFESRRGLPFFLSRCSFVSEVFPC